MNRRNFFKTVTGFVAGVFALLKAKAEPKMVVAPYNGSANTDDIEIIGSNPPAMSAEKWVKAQFNPVKELQLGEPFAGKIVSMINFQGNLWIATEKGVYKIKDKFGEKK